MRTRRSTPTATATRARSPAAITRRARGCGRSPPASRTRFPTAGGSAARTPTGGTRSRMTGCRRTSSCSRSTTPSDTCLSWADTEAWAQRLGVDLGPAPVPRPVRAREGVRAARRRLGLRARARGDRAALGGGLPARRSPARGRQARPPRPRQDRPALDARRGGGQWSLPATPERGAPCPDLREYGLPWLDALAETPQSPVWHGEGDVLIHTRMVADELLRDERHQALDDEARDGAVARGAAARRRQAGHDALRERSLPRARPRPARRDHRPPAAVGGGDRAGGARADLRARPPPHGPASPDRARGADPQLHRDLARGRRVPPVPADPRRRARADRRRRRRAGDQRRAVRRVRARPRLPGRAVPVRLRPRALHLLPSRRSRPGLRRARRHAQPRRRPLRPAGRRARTCGSPATATAGRSSRSTTYAASGASSAGTRRPRAG